MTRKIQQPAVAVDDGGDRTSTHPAFGTISASRINGTFNLFGSNVGHGGAVMVEVHGAVLRSLSSGGYENVSPRGQLVRLYLTEAQWVAFVSRMNHGSGTPCTLQYARTGPLEELPGLPEPEKPAERLHTRAQEMLDASQKKQDEARQRLEALIAESGLSAKKAAALLTEVRYMHDHGQVNRDYQRTVLAEDAERHTTEAKIEIDAMLTGAVRSMGLRSVRDLAALMNEADAAQKQIEGDDHG